jgi:hypothetical protein
MSEVARVVATKEEVTVLTNMGNNTNTGEGSEIK